jgi:hypothetical protein
MCSVFEEQALVARVDVHGGRMDAELQRQQRVQFAAQQLTALQPQLVFDFLVNKIHYLYIEKLLIIRITIS